jgi:thymidylate synthase (FAD)
MMPESQIKATLVNHMGSDLTVTDAARVSFGKKSEAVGWEWYDYESGSASGDYIAVLNNKDQKLIRYLAKHEHYSPFGHCFLSFHIKAPIFVRAQLVKHEYLRMNEISRRYVEDSIEFYTPDVWRGKAKDKKQGSADWSVPFETWPLIVKTGENLHDGYEWTGYYQIALELYNHLISVNLAPEQARMVLPQSLMTEWYWSGSLDAFANMCNLRLKEDTQYETRLVAQQISRVVGELFPVSWPALIGEDT